MRLKPLRSTAPATSILSPRFNYVPAARTDIRETFRRAEQQQHDEWLNNMRQLAREGME